MLGTRSLPTDHCGLWAPTLNKTALWTTDSKPGNLPVLLSSPLSHTWLPRLWLGLMLSRVTTYIMGPQLLATANGRIYQMVESLSWGIGNLMNHLASGHLPKLRWLRSLGRGKSVLRPGTEGDSDWHPQIGPSPQAGFSWSGEHVQLTAADPKVPHQQSKSTPSKCDRAGLGGRSVWGGVFSLFKYCLYTSF